MKSKKLSRGLYNEILMSSVSAPVQKQVRNLVSLASKAAKVDEHGSWDFGLDFDNKGRGSALNWDLYSYGRDYFSKKFLAVIQVRQFIRRRKNGFGNVRKSYFLLGRNEDNTVFAHSVEAQVIHRAIAAGKDVIKAVQSWIFGCDYTKVIRQGDLALIPVKRTTAPALDENHFVIENSHVLHADEIRRNGHLYAKNPELLHVPGTHPRVMGEGWYKVIVGNRAKFWDFAAPTID